ncbi:MAG: hypothetical protein ABDI07_10355 [Candidatus Kryptonium sp.]
MSKKLAKRNNLLKDNKISRKSTVNFFTRFSANEITSIESIECINHLSLETDRVTV